MSTMSFSGSRDSRRSSSARRRQARATRIFLLVGSLFAMASFFGGYAWQAQKTKLRGAAAVGAADVPADPAARAEALDHIDEAIRAKHEKRAAGALSALERARRADRSLPGLDVMRAELALKEQNLIAMRAAASSAKKKGENIANAEVLLGLDAWFNHGSSDKDFGTAVDAASAHFKEAATSDLFAAQTFVFWGEILRSAGSAVEGHGRTMSALLRLHPWDSSDVLTAKMIFAATEAGDRVIADLGVVSDSPMRQSVSQWATELESLRISVAQLLVPYTSLLAVQALTSDPFDRARASTAGSLPDNKLPKPNAP